MPRRALRQLPLAAHPDALFGFHLRHLEQSDQHAELVTPRHPRQFGDALCDEDCSLLRPAILHRIIFSRTAIPARGWPRSPAPCLGQNYVQWVSSGKIRLLRVQLWQAFYNFFDAKESAPGTLSTSGDLTGASRAPMFGTKRPTRVSRNRPLFFP